MCNVHDTSGVRRSKLLGMLPYWEHNKRNTNENPEMQAATCSLSLYFCDYIMTLRDIFYTQAFYIILYIYIIYNLYALLKLPISPFWLEPHSLLLQLEFALSTCMERQSLFLKLFRKPGCFKQMVGANSK